MHRTTALLKLLAILSLTPLVICGLPLNPPIGGAGYDTSRIGPDNANCQRQNYSIDVTSNNVVFKNVDSNANTASTLSPLTNIRAYIRVQ